MTFIIQTIQKNRVFKFISSVRLAVPLMLVIASVIAAGTLYESAYNAQVARIMVYQTWWFHGLMILLWINIFAAAFSRIPYREHHTGFVITHIGLLTLLIGAMITAKWGLDGQLRVPEGQSSNIVYLDNLVLKVRSSESGAAKSYAVERRLEPLTGDQLGLSQVRDDFGILVDNYLPFVTTESVMVPSSDGSASSATAITFSMKSQFFNVTESLHSQEKPEMQMGPAHLKLIQDTGSQGTKKRKSETSSETSRHSSDRALAAAGSVLVVKDATTNEILKKVPLEQLRKSAIDVHGVKISLMRAYEQGVVSANKLAEKGQPGANPALELKIEKGGQTLREVAFSKFADFSLNSKGTFGLKFEYLYGGAEARQEAEQLPMHGQAEQGAAPPVAAPPMGAPPAMGEGGNTIEFHVNPADVNSLRVVLLKNGAQVLSQVARVGEVIQTPWMGMQLTVNSIVPGGVSREEIKPSEMLPKQPLPPSALFIRSDIPGTEGGWMPEGSTETIQTSRGPIEVYYGQDSVTLPFEIKLDQFRKVDYPGTETALSFESTIRLNGGGAPMIIQMNEPLQHDGYLLYQSSYEMGQGMQTASIFSVNKDPGRWIKYIGAIILIIGIALFTVMRTKWYMNLRKNRSMKKIASVTAMFLITLLSFSAHADGVQGYQDFSPEAAKANLIQLGTHINSSLLEELPTQSHGRVKPLDSFARETILFLTGKYSMWGLDPVQLFLALSVSNGSPYVPVINVRDPELRTTLGFQKSDRYFSLQELENSPLQKISAPIIEKEQKNEKLVTPDEKKILETVQQVWLMKAILTGDYLNQAIVLDLPTNGATGHGAGTELVLEQAQRYLNLLKNGDFSGANMAAMEFLAVAKSQAMPELFSRSIGKMHAEVLYNHIRPFFWVGILYMLLGVTLVSGMLADRLKPKVVFCLLLPPLLLHAAGFASRVYITGFAPVTNMYGTMVWMAFGVVFFGSILYGLYRNSLVFGLLLIGSSATLLLTESIPLILSPDMDPIVAVLRNNFWLTIHVLTISISYAAFTIAMLIGNTGLIQTIFRKDTPDGFKNLVHLAYRAMQLGVFLLTTGIILGGWWADYSWGRFWGWDPKETWALIADLGFLAILHARYVGWLGHFAVLAAAPIAYLLVIMAWYGVNFILAAGLHSYGFSSGGATIVAIFVSIQLIVFAAGVVSRKLRTTQRAA